MNKKLFAKTDETDGTSDWPISALLEDRKGERPIRTVDGRSRLSVICRKLDSEH